ncbi:MULTISPECIES: tyrosine-type recombinase/integrase [Leptospira]|uniref:Site-specific recombinase, phage integrase family n=1 Tax=Leptospira licerasiae str. MMD4847 TaxID=1049971 RepID=A0ABP2RHW5_9LEPT|nr:MULTISPECIES: tyrosine-type recombinase/integrase [Leptospira]EIE01355.1 site-specific recombinase, phage integrase family [Leptospira licerasiae serovar Varillal str. VAR 010]EJZ43220.1 site-specific recombinase, phage integrase family [Leptospira licerasiae str. MMD4847]
MSIRSNVIRIEEYQNRRSKGPRDSEPETGIMLGKGLTDQTMVELTRKFSTPVTERDFRNRALFSLMSKTGLRAKEIVSLRFSQLFQSPSSEMLITYIKKGGRRGFSVIAEETLLFLKEYHSWFKEKHDYFILSLSGRNQSARSNLSTRGLQLIVNSWGVTTCSGRLVHPHSLRHTLGAKLLETAGSIAAQKVLGHSTPVTTSKYYTKPYFDASKFLTWE